MNIEALQEAAIKLEDETLRTNAEALISKMDSAIEGIGDRDIKWRPSILKVVQKMTDLDNLPDGAKAGAMVLGDELLGKAYNVIPLRTWDSRLMWNPDEQISEIICQSPDAKNGYKYGECYKCPHSKFGEGGSACNKQKNFIVVAADLSEVFTCTFAKSAFAMGKEWEGVMRKAKTHPYKRMYSLSTDSHPKYKQVKVLNAHVQSDALPEDVVTFLEVLFNNVSQDRAEAIERFYEGLQNRADTPALENQSEDVQALEVKEGEIVEGAENEGAEYTI